MAKAKSSLRRPLTRRGKGPSTTPRKYVQVTVSSGTRKQQPLAESTKNFMKNILEVACGDIMRSAGDEIDNESKAMLVRAEMSILAALDQELEPAGSVDIHDLAQKKRMCQHSLVLLEEKLGELSKVEIIAKMNLERVEHMIKRSLSA